MAKTLTITNIKTVGGKYYISFSSGREFEFASLSQFQDLLDDIPDDIFEKIILAIIRKRLPNLTNVQTLVGRGITVDFTSNTWGTVI